MKQRAVFLMLGTATMSLPFVFGGGELEKHSVDAERFYKQWDGHPIDDLQLLWEGLAKIHNQNPASCPSQTQSAEEEECEKERVTRFIMLVGDSSLDNKHWVSAGPKKGAVNGYEKILQPPESPADVSYWMNHLLAERLPTSRMVVLNAAVEESTVEGRLSPNALKKQDDFVRQHLSTNDILVVSVGGNDVALAPTEETTRNMFAMLQQNSIETIQKGPQHAVGLPHMIRLLKDRVVDYVRELIKDTKPSLIVVCMIYFPDEKSNKQEGSWADSVLGAMGYDADPRKLQAAIEQFYRHGTALIQAIDGVPVVGVPLFEAMDGTDPSLYVSRVEPSATGGLAMAKLLLRAIDENSTPFTS